MSIYISANTLYVQYFILALQAILLIYSLYVLIICCRSLSCIGAFLSAIVLIIWSYQFPAQDLFPVMDLALFVKESSLLTFFIGALSSVCLVLAYRYRENIGVCALFVFSFTMILVAGSLDVSLTSNIAIAAVAGKSIGLTLSYASVGK